MSALYLDPFNEEFTRNQSRDSINDALVPTLLRDQVLRIEGPVLSEGRETDE
jgi:hypothetical protein